MPDPIGYLLRGAFLQVFINVVIVILLRGKCPRAKLKMIDNQQYAKTGRGGGLARWKVVGVRCRLVRKLPEYGERAL